MSPTSSPVPRLSSVPSAVLTVRTIASRSPGRTTNKGEERADTLTGSGWMPSPPPLHRSTSNQKGSHSFCLSSCPPRPLFCSVCCPHRPHHRQPLIGSHHQQRRGKSGHPARLWVDAIDTTSPPIDQQPEGQPLVLSVILPASSSSPSSSPPSGGEGREESQPGRAIPSRSSCRPSPPFRGVPGHKAVKFFLSSDNQGYTRAVVGLF